MVGSRRGRRPSLTITAEYQVPFESAIANANVHARTTIVSLRAVPALELAHASWFAIDVGAGAGVDIVSVNPTPGGGITLKDVATRVDPILTALATAYASLAPGVTFTLVVGAEVDPAAPRYFVGGAQGENIDLLTPWLVRPVALAGFTFTAVGSSLFARAAQ